MTSMIKTTHTSCNFYLFLLATFYLVNNEGEWVSGKWFIVVLYCFAARIPSSIEWRTYLYMSIWRGVICECVCTICHVMWVQTQFNYEWKLITQHCLHSNGLSSYFLLYVMRYWMLKNVLHVGEILAKFLRKHRESLQIAMDIIDIFHENCALF